MLHEKEKYCESESFFKERQPDTGDTGTAGEDESVGTVVPESFTGDTERLRGDREGVDLECFRGGKHEGGDGER